MMCSSEIISKMDLSQCRDLNKHTLQNRGCDSFPVDLCFFCRCDPHTIHGWLVQIYIHTFTIQNLTIHVGIHIPFHAWMVFWIGITSMKVGSHVFFSSFKYVFRSDLLSNFFENQHSQLENHHGFLVNSIQDLVGDFPAIAMLVQWICLNRSLILFTV